MFTKLLGWAGPQQLMGPDTILMSAYYDDPSVTPPEELKLDVCMTIEDDAKVEGEIRKEKASWRKVCSNACGTNRSRRIWSCMGKDL